MRNAILAWYAYSESGSAGPAGADLRPANRPAALEPERPDHPVRPAADLDEPAHVAGLFGDVRALDAQVDASGWKHLFSRYGLDGLIDLAKRRGGWPDATRDETVAEAIVSESLDAGYDPVSDLIGEFKVGEFQTGEFQTGEFQAGEFQTGEFTTSEFNAHRAAVGPHGSAVGVRGKTGSRTQTQTRTRNGTFVRDASSRNRARRAPTAPEGGAP